MYRALMGDVGLAFLLADREDQKNRASPGSLADAFEASFRDRVPFIRQDHNRPQEKRFDLFRGDAMLVKTRYRPFHSANMTFVWTCVNTPKWPPR